MNELTAEQWIEQPVRISRGGVHFGSHALPGVIAKDGITLAPATGGQRHNVLTVDFLVGQVLVDDPDVQQVPVTSPEETRYMFRPTPEDADNGGAE